MSAENGKPSTQLSTQCAKSSPETERRTQLSTAIGILAVLKGTALEKERLKIYIASLADLPLEPLLKAIDKWSLTKKGFPDNCELRELVTGPIGPAEAEIAWNEVVAYVDGGYYSPEQGHRKFWGEEKSPELPPRTLYAMRQIGGFYRLWYHGHGDDEFQWLHRQFIEAWNLVPTEERLAGSLAPKALLERIQQNVGKNLLPQAPRKLERPEWLKPPDLKPPDPPASD
jgi:hypothetical protein